MANIANILTIAGSDSSGGAGVQADIKAISANGAYAASVISALTAQNTKGVQAVASVDVGLIRAQIDAVMDDLTIDAIKIGMLGQDHIIACVAQAMEYWQKQQEKRIPIILDPVMVAKSGDMLLEPSAVASLKTNLLPLANLITPNLPEAATLCDLPIPTHQTEMEAMASSLRKLGAKAILLKGGHLQSRTSPDLLIDDERQIWLHGARIKAKNTHGTGCTLSASIATYMGKGYALLEAVEAAKAYLSKALTSADALNIGQGIGPVDHFGLAKE